jgi:hypothetical protein
MDWVIASVIGGILAMVLLVVALVGVGSYYSDRASCRNWGDQARRETVFRHLTQPLGIPLTWDCFTPVGDGRYLPIDRVREFDE